MESFPSSHTSDCQVFAATRMQNLDGLTRCCDFRLYARQTAEFRVALRTVSGKHDAGFAEQIRTGIPDQADWSAAQPGDTAVDVVVSFPESFGLPRDFVIVGILSSGNRP